MKHRSRNQRGGASIEFTELEAGEYTVEAEAWDSESDELIASGSKDIKVEADKTTECSFSLIISNCFVAKDGNIVMDKTKLEKTALTIVIDTATTITGSGSDGVFINDRTVTLSPYSIGKYEVTQELFEAVMGENPSSYSSSPEDGETQELRPVEQVSCFYAIVFCNRLSLLMGFEPCYTAIQTNGDEVPYDSIALSAIKTDGSGWTVSCDLSKNGYRLPTAAEWEFAARGGDQSANDWSYKFAGSNDIEEVAWYNEDGVRNKKTHEVGLKNPNSLGLYDMSGNCFEICWDFLASSSSSPSAGKFTDPYGESGPYCYRLGGGCMEEEASLVVTKKSTLTASSTTLYGDTSFRLARSGFPRAN